MYEKTMLVKQLYERFNMNYGNLVDMTRIDNAINNMVVVKSDMSNVPYNIQRRIEHGARALNADGKIYVKSDVLNIIEKSNNMRLYLLKQSQEANDNLDIDAIIEEAVLSIKTR